MHTSTTMGILVPTDPAAPGPGESPVKSMSIAALCDRTNEDNGRAFKVRQHFSRNFLSISHSSVPRVSVLCGTPARSLILTRHVTFFPKSRALCTDTAPARTSTRQRPHTRATLKLTREEKNSRSRRKIPGRVGKASRNNTTRWFLSSLQANRSSRLPQVFPVVTDQSSVPTKGLVRKRSEKVRGCH
jgi:hypothetical protein